MEEEAPLEEKVSQVSAEVPVCFSCGRRGHGVNRCSRVDTCFPFLPPEWSVDVWNGQYRATRTVRAGLWSPPGNEGWSGREGQPPGSSGIKVQLTLVGELGDVRPCGSCRWSAGGDLNGPQTPSLFRPWEASSRQIVDSMIERVWTALKGCWEVGADWVRIHPIEMDGSSWSVVPPRSRARRNERGMRPAGGNGPCLPGLKKEPMAEEGRTDTRPISLEAEEFSPEFEWRLRSGKNN